MLICKNCKIELEGNFCPQCGGRTEAVGIDSELPTEETIVENAVEDERMIPRPIAEGELAEEVNQEDIDAEAEALRIEQERINAENENKARQCAKSSVFAPILIIVVSAVCCPVMNIVSIVLAIVSLVKRSTMLRLFEEKRYEEGFAASETMGSALRWSWITLIISLVVGVIALAVGVSLGSGVN